jgi:hypothetical protein
MRGRSAARRRSALALATVLALAVPAGGCERHRAPPSPPEVKLSWQEVSLPAPPGDPGRTVVRSATVCGGRWYLVGGVATADGATRPAAWTSADARSWEPVPVAGTSYYGKQNILYAVACHDGGLAAVGARSGGVHGNPRVSSWVRTGDGTLSEVIAAFTLYGGGDAVNVARMTAGPGGYLIVGNRVTGAAVWTSPDATSFTIHENVPMLASDQQVETAGADGAGTAAGWTVVGGAAARGRVDRDPVAWTSADGATWQRTLIAGTGDYEELQRVVPVDGGLLAVGLSGAEFGAWRGEAGGWRAVGRFGSTAPPAGSGAVRVSGVQSAAAGGGGVLVAVSNGVDHQLWLSQDSGASWAAVAVPGHHPAGADRAAAVASDGQRWLFLADDATAGQVWLADFSR